MLSLAARQGALARQLLPAAAFAASSHVQERGMKIFEIFSKEEREKRKAKSQLKKDEKAKRMAQLKEEMQRGYFDDFRDFRDSKGKAFMAAEKLVAAASAPPFPRLEVVLSDGRPAVFPPAPAAASCSSVSDPSSSNNPSSSGSSGPSGSSSAAEEALPAASLVCVAFRAGAQPMLEAWAGAFAQHFRERSASVALYELAIVEGVVSLLRLPVPGSLRLHPMQVMRMWPFKQLLLRGNAAGAGKYALPCRHLHHFGDMRQLREALRLTNLLTGYVFLVDAQGRLRWRGSGTPSDSETATLLRCTEELLQQEGAEGRQQPRGQQVGAGAEAGFAAAGEAPLQSMR